MQIEDAVKGRFRNDYHKGLINLIFTAHQLDRRFNTVLKTHRLTQQQYNVLRILRGFGPEPCSVAFIKERMLDQSSDVSRIVDRLRSRGLVAREESIADRRRKDICLTHKGHALLDAIFHCEQEADTFLSRLTKTEIAELNRLLDKLRG